MRYRILLFCLLTGFLSQRTSSAACTLFNDYCVHTPNLVIAEDESPNESDLLFKPFIPRKLKSKASEVIEISNGFVDWYSHCFIPLKLLFVQNSDSLDGCVSLFLRGPPRL
jgi:hypothetical protein